MLEEKSIADIGLNEIPVSNDNKVIVRILY